MSCTCLAHTAKEGRREGGREGGKENAIVLVHGGVILSSGIGRRVGRAYACRAEVLNLFFFLEAGEEAQCSNLLCLFLSLKSPILIEVPL